jgi:hypothetical protein
VDKVTWLIAESIMIPKTIAIGCNHKRLYPARTPRNRLDAKEPPPKVIALWSQPGPDNLVYAPSFEKRPEASAWARYFFSFSIDAIHL